MLQNSFTGIDVFGKELKISQLADDTTIFLKSTEEVSMALSALSKFSDVSGLKLNLKTCEILSLNNTDLTEICGIPVKDTVTYLGIKISKDPKEVMNNNLLPVVEAIKKKFNCWLARDLSIHGRVLLSKAEGLSRASYMFSSLDVSRSICSKLDSSILYGKISPIK